MKLPILTTAALVVAASAGLIVTAVPASASSPARPLARQTVITLEHNEGARPMAHITTYDDDHVRPAARPMAHITYVELGRPAARPMAHITTYDDDHVRQPLSKKTIIDGEPKPHKDLMIRPCNEVPSLLRCR